jgi:thiosulfate reductase cytochrome b subunit
MVADAPHGTRPALDRNVGDKNPLKPRQHDCHATHSQDGIGRSKLTGSNTLIGMLYLTTSRCRSEQSRAHQNFSGYDSAVATLGSLPYPSLSTSLSDNRDSARHSALVRAAHWINALSFFGLLVSGFAILLAHPRFYWGEAGGIGTPSILDLPLPLMKGGPSGWGRNLHFLSAWVCVLNSAVYILSGVLTPHFRHDLLPVRAQLTWRSLSRSVLSHLRFERPGVETYNVLQRLTYLCVIFILFPLLLWTGFAMSPAIVSVVPAFVTVLGGQETARTLHFFIADFVVLFFVVHIAMICLAGFGNLVRAMITGHTATNYSRRAT